MPEKTSNAGRLACVLDGRWNCPPFRDVDGWRDVAFVLEYTVHDAAASRRLSAFLGDLAVS